MTSLIAVQRGLASSTAGGTHHAFPDHGAGFCLMNDMAVAARYLIKHNIVRKVLIVDLDVHQVRTVSVSLWVISRELIAQRK